MDKIKTGSVAAQGIKTIREAKNGINYYERQGKRVNRTTQKGGSYLDTDGNEF